MKCEILMDDAVNPKGLRMLRALVEAAPTVGLTPVVRPRTAFVGDCKFLLAYGIGSPHITACMRRMVEIGRHAIGTDLGYYGRRAGGGYPQRFTIDAPHPQRLLADYGPERWEKSGIKLRNDYREEGHVVVAGLGAKSRIQYGFNGTQWESLTIQRLRAQYPMKKIVYRPKIPRERLPQTTCDWANPIEEVLRGASLVVVHHSNVAVDACIAGIPVVCTDGAARALYAENSDPTVEQRLAFLQKLAWWQWRPEEAQQCWKFLLMVLSSM